MQKRGNLKLAFIILITSLLSEANLCAQSSYFRANDERVNFYADLIDVKSKVNFHTEFKPFSRSGVFGIRKVYHAKISSFPTDLYGIPYKEWLEYSYSEYKDSVLQRTKPLLKHFYKTKSEFFHYGGKDFDVFVNPVIGLETGSTTEGKYFRNSRGAEIKGHIGGKVGFYTFLTDNQVRFPKYLSDKIAEEGVVPRQGFWKPFKTDGYDYFEARGYITFSPIKQIKMAFGNDRNFIGNGYRSLVLSDYGKDYLNLKVQTNIGKVSYQNLFMELHNFSPLVGNTLIPKKYAAIHRVGVNIGDWGNVGLFESIVFSRGDSLGGNGGFDFAYLNPLIFYRSVEQNLGSKDNALLGFDFKANIRKKFSIYTQVLLDEFKLEHIRANDGWWANKYGLQLGAKWFDMFGSNFHGQLEYNRVRPYTYAHTFTDQSYSHYGQALAHPLGANFNELVGILRYIPSSPKLKHKLFVTGKLILAKKGADSTFSNTTNFGGNIFRSNATRFQDFNNTQLQGVKQNLSIASLELSFMPWHNLFLDASVHIRNFDSQFDLQDSENTLFRFAIRYNLGRIKLDY